MVFVSSPQTAKLELVRDRGYLFDVGLLFTMPGLSGRVRHIKRRREATISLSIYGTPFNVRIAGEDRSYQAIAIKSLVTRTISYPGVPVASILVGPLHPDFRSFRGIRGPGGMSLPREAFAPFDETLAAAYDRGLSYVEARRLFEDIVQTAKQYLPRPKPLDARIERVIALLQEDMNRPLQELAAAVHVSYHRLSHLFTESVGLPLRSYQLWQKMHKAFALWIDGHSSAEIVHAVGLSDVSHFHRVCRDTYGFSPTFFLGEGVELFRLPAVSGSDVR